MSQNRIESIAIDGSAGVGKSTVSKKLAKKLGWGCLNTGALYRALTVKCLKEKTNVQDVDAVLETLKNVEISVKFINSDQHVYINDKDVTTLLHHDIVDKTVPYVAKIPAVREKVKKIQRDIATSSNVVVEGRDIGSVVLKDSINKFFLTASLAVRAERRYNERIAKGEEANYQEILKDIEMRDEMDRKREVSPLVIPEDACVVDTSNRTVDDIVDYMFSKVKKLNNTKERAM